MKGNIDVLIICSSFVEGSASYRRLFYLIKYMRHHNLRIKCVGFLQLAASGLSRPYRECYPVSLNISSKAFVFELLNTLLSMPLIALIAILRPKVILASVPDTSVVLATYIGSVLSGSKLVIDIRDPQEEIFAYTHRGKTLLTYIIKIYRKVNYTIYKKAHAITAVTRSIAIELSKQLGRVINVAPNGADLSVFKPFNKYVARNKLRLPENAFLIAYAGFLSLSGYYDLVPVLYIIRTIKKKQGINIKLVVAGAFFDKYIKKIITLFQDELIYLGFLGTEDLVMMLSACDLGIIPRIGDSIYNYAIPAKFYEYIAVGLPLIVLANKESELAKSVNKNELGFVCEPRDYICLERVITKLVTNEELLNKLKHNVFAFRKHVDRKIGAEKIYKIVIRLLQLNASLRVKP